MGHTSMSQFHTGDDHFLTAAGYYRNVCSTKSIVIFTIELGIWVIRACANLGCNGGTFFDSGRLLWIMMMFQPNLI